jgi:hypothetical protein
MKKRWIEVDDWIFAGTLEDDGGERFRLSVERLPAGGWDWVVWNLQLEARYGSAGSREAALTAAEAAIAMIGARAAIRRDPLIAASASPAALFA